MTPGEAGSAAGRALRRGRRAVTSSLTNSSWTEPFRPRFGQATGAMTGDSAGFALPAFLPAADEGCPVYDPAALANDEQPEAARQGGGRRHSIRDVRRPVATADAGTHGQRRVRRGGVGGLHAHAAEEDFAANNKDHTPCLLVTKAGAFNATNDRWTFGLPRLRKDKVSILYQSYIAPRSETPRAEDVRVVGRAFGVFVDGVLQKLGGA